MKEFTPDYVQRTELSAEIKKAAKNNITSSFAFIGAGAVFLIFIFLISREIPLAAFIITIAFAGFAFFGGIWSLVTNLKFENNCRYYICTVTDMINESRYIRKSGYRDFFTIKIIDEHGKEQEFPVDKELYQKLYVNCEIILAKYKSIEYVTNVLKNRS